MRWVIGIKQDVTEEYVDYILKALLHYPVFIFCILGNWEYPYFLFNPIMSGKKSRNVWFLGLNSIKKWIIKITYNPNISYWHNYSPYAVRDK